MKICEINKRIPTNSSLVKFLFDIYDKPKDMNISRKNRQIIYGTLNAFFIYQCYLNNQEKDGDYFFYDFDEYINKFKKREEINDSNFICQVYDYLNSLEDKFLLYIPKFKPSDLLFLFINKESDKNDGEYF